MTVKKKFRLFKYFLNLLLISALVAVLIQNNHSVPIELLFWEVNISLSILILGMAVLGALITFITVLIIGRG